MPFWTYQNLAKVTAGTWLIPPPPDLADAVLPAALKPAGPILWHDTREIVPGQCYLAIAGDNFDGHDFVDQAFAAGAALAIVQKQPSGFESGIGGRESGVANRPRPILLVEDTVAAMQQLARAYRAELGSPTSGGGGCRVIGIAGSNGKTTARHLIHHVLTHAGKRGTQSPKSFNNHLGVPLTLLAARPTDDFVAAEIGTNHPGEIDFLSEIARPDIAVITSIGEEHMEFFKTIEGVTKEELSIANYFDAKTLCVVGETVPWQGTCLEAAFMRAEPYDHIASHLRREIDPTHEPSQECAKLAAWVASLLGVMPDTIAAGIRCATLPPGRWEKVRLDQEVTLINDAYNANFTSVYTALQAFVDQPAKRKVFIFGDMLELGATAKKAHQDIGQIVSFIGIDKFLSIGPLTRDAHASIPPDMPSRHYEQWSDDLPARIAALLEPGDTVLLKGSRGMRLERLIPAIEARFGKAQ